MLTHVLVPLDGSPLAEEALGPAMQLLNAHGKITLVNAVELPYNWSYGTHALVGVVEYQALFDDLVPEANAYLEAAAEGLRQQEFEVDIIAEFGEAAQLILNTASQRNVEAIVMTTHGRTGFRRLLFGSVTAKVLAAAECPVLVVPSKEHMQQVEGKHIAIAAWPSMPTNE